MEFSSKSTEGSTSVQWKRKPSTQLDRHELHCMPPITQQISIFLLLSCLLYSLEASEAHLEHAAHLPDMTKALSSNWNFCCIVLIASYKLKIMSRSDRKGRKMEKEKKERTQCFQHLTWSPDWEYGTDCS